MAPDRVDDAVPTAHLRIARPTDRLDAVVAFYRALGFERRGSFEDHDGYDGVMLGHPDTDYHLEFTTRRDDPASGVPSPEHLLVFYLPDGDVWRRAVGRMRDAGYDTVEPENPYWATHGATFEDPDGYRVVLQNASWPTA